MTEINDQKSKNTLSTIFFLMVFTMFFLLYVLIYVESPEIARAFSVLITLLGGIMLYVEAVVDNRKLFYMLSNYGETNIGKLRPQLKHVIVLIILGACASLAFTQAQYDLRYSWIVNLSNRCYVFGNKKYALYLIFFLLLESILIIWELFNEYSVSQQNFIKEVYRNGWSEDLENGKDMSFERIKKRILQNYGISFIFFGSFIDLFSLVVRDAGLLNIFKSNF